MTQTSLSETPDTIDAAKLATAWIEQFQEALDHRDAAALSSLFRVDAYWRDLVSFSGQIRTLEGRDSVVSQLVALADKIQPENFRISTQYTPPSPQPRGTEMPIEAFLEFETAKTIGKGIVRLSVTDSELGVEALALMTAAQQLKGFEVPLAPNRPEHVIEHQFDGPNWKEWNEERNRFTDRNPEVVIVGAGQCGLTVAAELRLMGGDVLVIEKNDRVGDNWRNRYHSLTLHNPIAVNELPYMRFPATWPEYLPKDKWGGWLESWAESMEVPVWTNTEFLGGSKDPATGEWVLRIEQKDGDRTELRAKHVVIATGGGICAVPNIPNETGLDVFKGKALHSTQATNLDDFAGKPVVVFGTGTSAHDLADTLVGAGAHVTMVQRNSTNVLPQSTANMYLALFQERPADEVYLIANANSMAVTRDGYIEMTKIAAEIDREFVEKLEAAGFRTNHGLDDAGYFWNFLQRGGGYYINVGTSDRIINGEIRLVQHADIETFTETGLLLKDGEEIPAAAAIFATGYGNQQEQIRELFGDDVAEEVGLIWGYGEDGEIRNTWRPTPVDGLWIVAGGIPHASNYGLYVALQLKARLAGLISGTDVSASTLWN